MFVLMCVMCCPSGAVFVVTFVMMGLNVWAAAIVMVTVCMIIIHMLGCMALAGINANAVSLVNLVMVSVYPKPLDGSSNSSLTSSVV